MNRFEEVSARQDTPHLRLLLRTKRPLAGKEPYVKFSFRSDLDPVLTVEWIAIGSQEAAAAASSATAQGVAAV